MGYVRFAMLFIFLYLRISSEGLHVIKVLQNYQIDIDINIIVKWFLMRFVSFAKVKNRICSVIASAGLFLE